MKATLVYVPTALADLEEILQYISEDLQNPNAGSETVRIILEHIALLRDFSNAGSVLVDYFGHKQVIGILYVGTI